MDKSVEKSEGAHYRGVSWFFVIQKVTRRNLVSEYFYSIIMCFSDGDVEMDLMPFVWEQKAIFKLNENKGFPKNEYAMMRDWAQGFAEAGIDQKLDGYEPEMITVARDETNCKKSHWKPRTNPTAKQKLDMKRITNELIAVIGEPRLSQIADITGSTIRTWKMRGFVSAWMAIKLEKIPAIAKLGYTKNKLRPDIKDWPLDEI